MNTEFVKSSRADTISGWDNIDLVDDEWHRIYAKRQKTAMDECRESGDEHDECYVSCYLTTMTDTTKENPLDSSSIRYVDEAVDDDSIGNAENEFYDRDGVRPYIDGDYGKTEN